MTFLSFSLRENMCVSVCLCILNQYKGTVITARWTQYIMSHHHVRAGELEVAGGREEGKERVPKIQF